MSLSLHHAFLPSLSPTHAEVEGWFPLKSREGKSDLVSGEVHLKIIYRTP